MWYGRSDASAVWPPACTPEGADRFQYAPPPDRGIPCCEGLVACQEPRPADWPGGGGNASSEPYFEAGRDFDRCNPTPDVTPTPTPTLPLPLPLTLTLTLTPNPHP